MTIELDISKSIIAEIPDWPTRFWDPSRKLLLAIQRYQYWRSKGGLLPAFFRRLVVLRYRFWSVVTGADIGLTAQIGMGLSLPHPNGVVIHRKAKIGINCLILQQVTIGIKEYGNDEDAPVIDDCVKISSGAKILGPIHVGAYATIGANAVVLDDVPANTTVVGVPARQIR